ncbi:MAG TPA: nucleoside transporter C-terminal domain-containing protein [Acidobacteriota bacterium]|jgi:CNT family concentrative nucleoside transporter
MERWISALGLLVLMGIAYLFSRHRREVQFRTIAWGVGLQLLLAVTILGSKLVSFGGMFVLAFLVVLYVFEEEFHKRAAGLGKALPWVVGAATLAASAAVVALFYVLAPYYVTLALLIAAAVAVAVAIKLGREHLARVSFAAILVLGVAELWARDVHGEVAFRALSDKVASFLALSNRGAEFLFSNLVDPQHWPATDTWPGFGFQFAFSVLPTIIFFSAFMSCMYYLGIVQVVIAAIARFMRWSMGTSGSETMSCSANIFVGQTEAPFLIKPFINDMTISELHAIMVGGFATVAGGVLAGYIRMGVDAGHLIAASVMSAPAALVIAKLLLPETEESKTAGDVELPEVETADNLVEAAASGTTDGLKLALNVGAMLIAFIALIAVCDTILGYFDGLIDGRLLGGALIEGTTEFAGFFPGSLQTFFGTLLRPLAWVMGVPWQDSLVVGNLLGVKIAVNEFVSYGLLSQHIAAADLQERSIVIATYALCGFANFSSIGIQIGGISALVPERRKDLARVGVRAMFGGALASWMTATIAGILI